MRVTKWVLETSYSKGRKVFESEGRHVLAMIFSTKCSVTFLCTPAILLIVLNALSAASSFNTSELSAHAFTLPIGKFIMVRCALIGISMQSSV